VLLLLFFLLLLLVAQVAMKTDIREGGVSCGICWSRIVAGAAASRRGGGSDAAWQLHGSLEQSVINSGPLTSLIYTLAFFLYTHTYNPHVHKRSMNARSSVGDSEMVKKKKKMRSNNNKRTSQCGLRRPKSGTFE